MILKVKCSIYREREQSTLHLNCIVTTCTIGLLTNYKTYNLVDPNLQNDWPWPANV